MRIAQIAPLWVPVPPRTHGGTELVVSLLTEELVRRGNEVTLFASGDSQTSGKLVSTCARAIWRDPTLKDPHACIMSLLGRVITHANDFDIIHSHTGFYFTPFAQHIPTPVVQTLHRPIYPETHRLYQEAKNVSFVAISQDQAKSATPLPIAKMIYNGIDIAKYPFAPESRGYLLFLSRIAPDKGVIEAIEAARLAKKKLIIAGNIIRRKFTGDDDYDFFVRRVKPRIDGEQIIYAGEADFGKKVELMRGADALLFPIRRREPFGLVVPESFACGTPVIAFTRGSTAELIEEGKTGFLVGSIRAMAQAAERVKELDRSECRKVAEERFSHLRMADEYETLYREILDQRLTANNSRRAQ
ncbi:MAG: hypothetical protein A2991_00510 [Candidatus Terrybacteria bacterium RIFCSPLOWO2_01_FULL_58_14]|uniref:Glycosyl transferase n=2 Tax=Candidatus Terryibacteriota TaxID=1817920 RepID=A0A1G2PWS2_9BACT|nr:MAG: hypothetical protein A2682_00520 [Candidatus Terrybacteria bacterium RIFCSPHIGHO2_01_FULL_58_15]OHA52784.1 MAG: hypothetical protein A2991_00510 [Candidatus Terrybacteria bacterium RIFCSPLOWO2_01_FULL_58_14]